MCGNRPATLRLREGGFRGYSGETNGDLGHNECVRVACARGEAAVEQTTPVPTKAASVDRAVSGHQADRTSRSGFLQLARSRPGEPMVSERGDRAIGERIRSGRPAATRGPTRRGESGRTGWRVIGSVVRSAQSQQIRTPAPVVSDRISDTSSRESVADHPVGWPRDSHQADLRLARGTKMRAAGAPATPSNV